MMCSRQLNILWLCLILALTGCSDSDDGTVNPDVPVTDLTSSGDGSGTGNADDDATTGATSGNGGSGTDGSSSGGGDGTNTADDGSATDAGDNPNNDQPLSEMADFSNEQERLTDEQRDAFPTDCLLAINPNNGIAFCFSPTDRTLQARRIDGSSYWSFVLPQTNENNHVEGIEFVGGSSLVVVADTASEIGDSQYEMSVFHQSGSFQYTTRIFGQRNLRGDFAPVKHGININGEDVVVRSNGVDLFIAGHRFELIAGGDPANVDDWRSDSAFIARIDIANGFNLSYREVTGGDIQTFVLTTDSEAQMSDGTNTRGFNSGNLASTESDNSPYPLNSNSAPALVPVLYTHFRGDFLDPVRKELESLVVQLAINPTPAETPCTIDEGNADGTPCEYDVTSNALLSNCFGTGTVTHTHHERTSFVPGTGRSTSSTTTLAFENCAVDITNSVDLISGAYLINGTWVTERTEEGIRQGNRVIDNSTFEELSVRSPQSAEPTLLTGVSSTVSTYTSEAQVTRTLTFPMYKNTDLELTNLQSTHSTTSNRGVDIDYVSISGNMTFRGSITGNTVMEFLIDPALSNNYLTNQIPFSGVVRITASPDNSVALLATENAVHPSSEEFEYQLTEDDVTRSNVRPFESLLIPYFEE